MHYYKFNIADWNLGTAHLSLTEEAIYFRLINFYYDTEQPIPLETHSVFRRLRMANESDTAQLILDEFFTKTDRGYIHSRCDDLLKEYRKTLKNNRSNGAKGGRPRKDATHIETKTKPSGLFSETQTEPINNPNQEPLTINQEPRTNVKELAPQDAPPPKKRAARLPEDWKPDREYWEAAKLINPSATQEWFVGTANKFRDYWIAKSGKDATKVDWLATWRNWIRRDVENQGAPRGQYKTAAEKEAERNAYTFNLERARDF